VPVDTFYFGGRSGTSLTEDGGGGALARLGQQEDVDVERFRLGGTPHSGLNMDGWVGVDANVDTANCFRVMDSGQVGGCVISGAKSLFCGWTRAEANAVCYLDASGTGYGNDWRQEVVTPTFNYAGGDQISLAYDYSIDTELEYDLVDVLVEHYDSGTGAWVEHGDGLSGAGSRAVLTWLTSTYLSGPGASSSHRQVHERWFVVGRGCHGTTCGAAAFDNVILRGASVQRGL
jgi:hypothetical protein